MKTLREFSSSVLVAALGSAFGAVMLICSSVLASWVNASGGGEIEQLQELLDFISYVFLGLALYVAAIVTANTCSTVIAGRTRVLALQRLLGAPAGRLRREITSTGLLVGAAGALVGTAFAVGLGLVGVAVLRDRGALPEGDYAVLTPSLLVPVVAVVLTTTAAFFVGSRRVLTVRPLEALSSTVEARPEDLRGSRLRSVLAVLLVVGGVMLLLTGVVASAGSTGAVLVTMAGGFLSFTGVTVGAALFVPPVLALVGRIGAGNPAVLLSGRNALRAPGRSSRATIGLVIGVTLLVTFGVVLAMYQQRIVPALTQEAGVPEETFAALTAIVTFLSGFSAVIAAVGVVNALALGVLQRRREIGLLRAVGFTGAQARTMIIAEAVQMVVTALVLGTALGVLYGWAGTVSLFGALVHAPLTPALSTGTMVLVVVGGLLIAVLASLGPVRRVTRVAPTEALAVA
ncbi:ABC transporter permease [Frigoribacterium salinisoli]